MQGRTCLSNLGEQVETQSRSIRHLVGCRRTDPTVITCVLVMCEVLPDFLVCLVGCCPSLTGVTGEVSRVQLIAS